MVVSSYTQDLQVREPKMDPIPSVRCRRSKGVDGWTAGDVPHDNVHLRARTGVWRCEKKHDIGEGSGITKNDSVSGWQLSGILNIYPLVICYKAIENGAIIVSFPIKNGDYFHGYVK